MSRFDVCTIGEGQLRYCVDAGTRLETARRLDVYACGTEANVAGLLSRLGWRCGWMSSLPNTPLGRRVANEFSLSGLDLSEVAWSDIGRLATYYVEYAEPPRSIQVYYDRAGTSFTQLTKADINWDYLLDSRIVHVSGLTIPLSAGMREIIPEAIRRAKEKHILVSLDVNYRRRIWTIEDAKITLAPLLREIDILFCSRGDSSEVFGIKGEPEEVVRKLGDISDAKFLFTSLSQEGLAGWDREKFVVEPACNVKIIDRIGAGDAMVAGVLHGLLHGQFEKAIRYGVTAAALALTQYGDQVVTTRGELEELTETPGTAGIIR